MIKKFLITFVLISVCNNSIVPAPVVGEHPFEQSFYAVDLRDLVYKENLHERYCGSGQFTADQHKEVRIILQQLGYDQSQTIGIFPLQSDVQALVVPTKNALYIRANLISIQNNDELIKELAYAVIYLQKGLYAPDRLFQAIAHMYCAAEFVTQLSLLVTSLTAPLTNSLFGVAIPTVKVSYGISDVTQTVHGALGSLCNECGWRALKNSDVGKAVSAHVPGLFLADYFWNMYTYQKCYFEISKITNALYARTKECVWNYLIKNPAEKLLQDKGLISQSPILTQGTL